MPLTTLEELEQIPKEELRSYLRWAGDLGVLYDKFIEEDDDDVSFTSGWGSSKGRSNGIHASEICSECLRPTYYSLTGTKRVDRVKPFWKKRFRAGHMFHAMLQDDFERICDKSGGMMTFQSEVKLAPEYQEICEQYDIHSSADGVLEFMDEPGGPAEMRVLVEFKTESDGQFENLKEPRDYHRNQVHIYMKALNIPVVLYFYLNKSNSNIAPTTPPYLETFDPKIWGLMLAKMINAHQRAKTGELPPKKEDMKCEFCAFSWTCQPDYLARKESMDKARKARKKARQKNPHKGIRRPRAP